MSTSSNTGSRLSRKKRKVESSKMQVERGLHDITDDFQDVATVFRAPVAKKIKIGKVHSPPRPRGRPVRSVTVRSAVAKTASVGSINDDDEDFCDVSGTASIRNNDSQDVVFLENDNFVLELKESIVSENEKLCASCKHLVPVSTFKEHFRECLQKFRLPKIEPRPQPSISDASEKEIGNNENLVEEKKNSDEETERSNQLFLPCPLCSKALKSTLQRQSHLKTCAQNRGIGSEKLLLALRLQEKQLEERRQLGLPILFHLSNEKEDKQMSLDKPKKKAGNSSAKNDPDLALALALSRSMAEEEAENRALREEQLLALGLDHIVEEDRKSKPVFLLPPANGVQKGSKNAGKPHGRKGRRNFQNAVLSMRSVEERERIVSEKVATILTAEAEHRVKWCERSVKGGRGRLANFRDDKCILWETAHSTLERPLGDFYVPDLEPYIQPKKAEVGRLLKRLSDIPGRLNITAMNAVDENSSCGSDSEEEEISIVEGYCTQLALADLLGSQELNITAVQKTLYGMDLSFTEGMVEDLNSRTRCSLDSTSGFLYDYPTEDDCISKNGDHSERCISSEKTFTGSRISSVRDVCRKETSVEYRFNEENCAIYSDNRKDSNISFLTTSNEDSCSNLSKNVVKFSQKTVADSENKHIYAIKNLLSIVTDNSLEKERVNVSPLTNVIKEVELENTQRDKAKEFVQVRTLSNMMKGNIFVKSKNAQIDKMKGRFLEGSQTKTENINEDKKSSSESSDCEIVCEVDSSLKSSFQQASNKEVGPSSHLFPYPNNIHINKEHSIASESNDENPLTDIAYDSDETQLFENEVKGADNADDFICTFKNVGIHSIQGSDLVAENQKGSDNSIKSSDLNPREDITKTGLTFYSSDNSSEKPVSDSEQNEERGTSNAHEELTYTPSNFCAHGIKRSDEKCTTEPSAEQICLSNTSTIRATKSPYHDVSYLYCEQNSETDLEIEDAHSCKLLDTSIPYSESRSNKEEEVNNAVEKEDPILYSEKLAESKTITYTSPKEKQISVSNIHIGKGNETVYESVAESEGTLIHEKIQKKDQNLLQGAPYFISDNLAKAVGCEGNNSHKTLGKIVNPEIEYRSVHIKCRIDVEDSSQRKAIETEPLKERNSSVNIASQSEVNKLNADGFWESESESDLTISGHAKRNLNNDHQAPPINLSDIFCNTTGKKKCIDLKEESISTEYSSSFIEIRTNKVGQDNNRINVVKDREKMKPKDILYDKFIYDWSTMLATGEGSDVILSLMDGEELSAHSFVILARCPELYSEIMKFNKCLSWSNIRYEGAYIFLEYLYIGRCSIDTKDNELWMDVFDLALKYKCSDLITYLESLYIADSLPLKVNAVPSVEQKEDIVAKVSCKDIDVESENERHLLPSFTSAEIGNHFQSTSNSAFLTPKRKRSPENRCGRMVKRCLDLSLPAALSQESISDPAVSKVTQNKCDKILTPPKGDSTCHIGNTTQHIPGSQSPDLFDNSLDEQNVSFISTPPKSPLTLISPKEFNFEEGQSAVMSPIVLKPEIKSLTIQSAGIQNHDDCLIKTGLDSSRQFSHSLCSRKEKGKIVNNDKKHVKIGDDNIKFPSLKAIENSESEYKIGNIASDEEVNDNNEKEPVIDLTIEGSDDSQPSNIFKGTDDNKSFKSNASEFNSSDDMESLRLQADADESLKLIAFSENRNKSGNVCTDTSDYVDCCKYKSRFSKNMQVIDGNIISSSPENTVGQDDKQHEQSYVSDVWDDFDDVGCSNIFDIPSTPAKEMVQKDCEPFLPSFRKKSNCGIDAVSDGYVESDRNELLAAPSCVTFKDIKNSKVSEDITTVNMRDAYDSRHSSQKSPSSSFILDKNVTENPCDRAVHHHFQKTTPKTRKPSKHALKASSISDNTIVSINEEFNNSVFWREKYEPEFDNEQKNSKNIKNSKVEKPLKSKNLVSDNQKCVSTPHQKPGSKKTVTPMPNYKELRSPELKKELERYGIKPLSRNKAVVILEHVYEKTHPLVTDSEAESSFCETPQSLRSSKMAVNGATSDLHKRVLANKQKRLCKEEIALKNLSTGKNNSKNKVPDLAVCEEQYEQEECEDPLNSSQSSITSDGSVEDCFEETMLIGTVEEYSSTQQGNLKDQVTQFIKSDPELYQKILLYTPFFIEELHASLKANGIKCKMANLLDILDNQCITFRIQQGQRNRVRRRKCKKTSISPPKKSFGNAKRT
ncbi:hypothetical protein SK128_015732 [Halocaridina rubra]|uniref:Structure-specific endonuclease subunit SLX4 n=1 Tax=Halocaridina rubra TaxID=373956 RepID=A0AAN9A1G5_HALRR